MSEIQKVERAFGETLLALRPRLDNIVLVGGWLPWIYSRFLMTYLKDSSAPGYLALRSFLKEWISEKEITAEIATIFKELVQFLKKPPTTKL